MKHHRLSDPSVTPVVASSSKMESLISHQELFLRILSFLDSPHSLAAVQGVNRYWQRMSLDPQLWKRLYLSRYPHPHHSKLVYRPTEASSTPCTPRPLRPIARLPSRAFPPPSPSRSPSVSSTRAVPTGHAVPLTRREAAEGDTEVGTGVRNDGVDWKVMMRLGTNWSKGNASSQTTIALPPSPSPSITSTELPTTSPPTRSQLQAGSGTEQHIALSPSFIFTSNPTSPLVHVYTASSSSSVRLGIIPPPPGWSSPSRPDNVTAIAADQSVPDSTHDDGEGQTMAQRDLPVRLAVFYQSGGYVVLSVRTTESGGTRSLSWIREAILPPTSPPRRRTTTYAPRLGDPVVLAILHHPVLVTCTQGFHVSVYTLPSTPPISTPSTPQHLSTLHSDVSYHPAALSLFPSPTHLVQPSSFRASLTYCTPVYPSSWAVAAQEFDITLSPTGEGTVDRAECYHVGSPDEEDEEIVWPRRVKPVIGVKGRAGGIGTDGRWCILSGTDNQIQVYALPGCGPTPPPSPPSRGRGDGVITHQQTLLAHSARVTSVSLVGGRCVSGGNDGRVLLWDLDDEAAIGGGGVGRTVGYVEVRTEDERVWRGATGPRPTALLSEEMTAASGSEGAGPGAVGELELPHPQAISSAARSFFLPRPPVEMELEAEDRQRRGGRRPAIRNLAFDEEKIVGLVSTPSARGRGGQSGGVGEVGEVGEVMKVWSFG